MFSDATGTCSSSHEAPCPCDVCRCAGVHSPREAEWKMNNVSRRYGWSEKLYEYNSILINLVLIGTVACTLASCDHAQLTAVVHRNSTYPSEAASFRQVHLMYVVISPLHWTFNLYLIRCAQCKLASVLNVSSCLPFSDVLRHSAKILAFPSSCTVPLFSFQMTSRTHHAMVN